MAGAHLDSVTDGPGINDDGSGVAALLAAAGTLRGRAPDGARLRLGFWGAEELGLYGSRRYVAGLGEAARKAIAGYVNLDMVGTRDGDVAVYRGDDGIRRSLRRALTDRGVDDIQGEDLGASSDHAPFARAGIPVGGIFTGLDRCYHRACDDAGNVDPTAPRTPRRRPRRRCWTSRPPEREAVDGDRLVARRRRRRDGPAVARLAEQLPRPVRPGSAIHT